MELAKFKALHERFSREDLPEEARESEEYEAYVDAIHEDEACYTWATTEKLNNKGFDYESYCCLMMADKVFQSQDEEGETKQGDPDVIINKWDEGLYGIPIHDGSVSMVVINYCPWCGTKL
ncbi:DUF6980 family protein [Pontibacter akesuensis]|uniref:DUF6980 domain-containing protein n=1 Tax=Pontibacter akesuensis TaxID=388950 RepID=A0A1I7IN80_9BACT|nr:hypothetical protein [Pontibacter akesuensis]GHA67988.1 hypothetical protein GCM10007389_21710 [Pontibacter akesuensis]SFU74393.1 hypothetical protein SAMN04487941_2343 [Pontibacter akesuensis]